MVLTPEGYLKRYMDDRISKALRICGAVSIKGPKGCGKTWTAKNHANSALLLDDPENDYKARRFARESPNEALIGDEPRLIDEWQTAPAIWDATRRLVDQGKKKGRIILCGSSTPNVEAEVELHTGFARICPYKMRTMSLYESGDSDGAVSLSAMFSSEEVNTPWKDIDVGSIIGLIVRGGWPETLGMDVDDAAEFNNILVRTLIETDVQRIDKKANPRITTMLLRSLARNESTLANDKTIRTDMKVNEDDEIIAQSTYVKYRGYLDRLYILEDQPAFNPNLGSPVRVGKMPKRHLTDPSLAVAALRASPEMLSDDHRTLGFLFEALCERDLQIYAESLGGTLGHYRDGDGREIDAIVELPDGRWGAFEIKLTRAGIEDGAENLIKIRNYIKKKGGRVPSVLCVICGTAETAKLRPDGVYVVPITRLKA